MPNWCNNTLTLNEDSNDSILEVVKDYLDEGNLSLQKIRPIPEELQKTTSPTPKDIDPKVQKMLVEKYILRRSPYLLRYTSEDNEDED